jgi:hypothetical protein
VVLSIPLTASRAQSPDATEQESGRARFAGMQRVGGVITAIAGPQVTIKTADGMVYQIVTTDNTRVMRGRGNPGKLADLKAGDGLMAMGNLDTPNKTMHAAMVISVDADQMKKMEEAQKQQLANLGKTFIAGRVMAVDLDNATMTLERPDGVSQTIGFDEGTSFRRGRGGMGNGAGFGGGNIAVSPATPPASAPPGESITLADIKVGDRVSGPGELKSGKFVAKELNVMTPGAGRRRNGEAGSANVQPGAVSAQPGTPQPAASSPK